ncbi:hypothetical protein EK21DRAFT_55988 [Setomelanomma holmii]|uniref:Uncharacterized protein n=1 Tax=Setomelanomma holmii TaxID=210430 RepID=A0A9P4HII0_9PLEO|nr:hypothetical protein EK21DRAFT_55988 [Setomelanomma holmii]
MTSTAFEAALTAPDDDLSNKQLHMLVEASDYSGSTLPRIAEAYLRAFCDRTVSHVRRRWIGLALVGMLGASSAVVAHMKTLDLMLQGLGDVILGAEEREETRVIAGIIVRQALALRIPYASFWSSDKVRHSAPNFPQDSGPRWMSEFQVFLDTLGDLALANPVTDPSILYPVSVWTSDGFRWVSPNGSLPVVIVQHETVTVVLPDDQQSRSQFLEVPITSIAGTKTRASAPLHDSQAQSPDQEPWDLVLNLKRRAWTHLLNSSRCKARETTILFGTSSEAKECEMAIIELRDASTKAMGASQPHQLGMRSQPAQQSNDEVQGEVHDVPPQTRTTRAAVKDSEESDANLSDGDTASHVLEPNQKNQTTHGTGKLPKVSQATKLRASQQSRKQRDEFDLPEETGTRSAALKRAPKGKYTTAQSKPEKMGTEKLSIAKSEPSSQGGRKTRSKRKAENDDDFVSTGLDAAEKQSIKRNTKLDRSQKRTNGRNAVRSEQVQKAPSSIASTRTPLIAALLGVNKPGQATKATVHRPAREKQLSALPSTPTPHRPSVPTPRPKTPTVQGRSLAASAPLVPSSPPLKRRLEERHSSPRRVQPEAEVLSSNSKPVPASPHAESTAISGHATQGDVDLEKVKADMQTAKLDPFQQRREGPAASLFMRRLTGDGTTNATTDHAQRSSQEQPIQIDDRSSNFDEEDPALKCASQPTPQAEAAEKMEDSIAAAPQQVIDGTQAGPAAQPQNDLDADPDATLVNDDSEELPLETKASSLHFRSSPPRPGSSSCHSSTSAVSDRSSQPPMPTSEAEEMEWEATLQPHQRALHDLLIRVSNRVLRHIVDNETAVTDIADAYASDGEHLLDQVLRHHNAAYADAWENMETKKRAMRKDMEKSIKTLAKGRRKVGAIA